MKKIVGVWSAVAFLGCLTIWFQYPIRNIQFSQTELQMFQEDVKPLLDVIASGEGNYTSVNRGRAGDTPSTWPKENLGRDITEMTVAELRSHQAGETKACWYKEKKVKPDSMLSDVIN